MVEQPSGGVVPPSHTSARGQVRWVAGFVRPHGGALAWIAVTSLLGVAVGLAQPLLTQRLIDSALLQGNARLLVELAAAMVGIGLLSAGLGAVNRWIYITASARILFAMRGAVHAHLLRLSPGFYARWKTGDLMSRLDGDIGEILRFSIDAPLGAFNGIVMLGGALGFMLYLSPWLTALALVLLPVQVLTVRALRPLVERRTRALRERAADIASFLVRGLGLVKVTQAFRAEAVESARLQTLGEHYLTDLRRVQMLNHGLGSATSLLGSLGTAAVFVAGGLMVLDGRFTLGGLIAFTSYLGRASGPLQSLLSLSVGVQRVRVSLDRVMALLAQPPAVTDPPEPQPLPPLAAHSGRLDLDGVTFRHGDAPPVLDGVSLTLAPGSKVVLVGRSGAGKSTLADLLHRHFDPQAGSIRLDGVDLRALSLADLRGAVAVMGQEVLLMPGSIGDNIRLGRPTATAAEVRAAAEAAHLGPLLARLPQGLDSPVGEYGGLLSGGERQRIALARCLLLDPRLLVLDEPTSALDAATAADLAATLDRVLLGRTRLVITHRAEMLAGADAVWHLEDGRLSPQTATLPDERIRA